ncbi:MAG: N-acetylmuramoyl-L-alanine amidase [bacterium]
MVSRRFHRPAGRPGDWIGWLGIGLAGIGLAALIPLAGAARELSGLFNNQTIRLRTELLEGGEYVRDTGLVIHFKGRWQYDALSGTLTIVRPDGVRVGLKAGDPRVIVGERVLHTGAPSLRLDHHLFIPFQVVVPHLFPQVQFVEQSVEETVVSASEETPTATPVFNYSPETSATPQGLIPTPILFQPGLLPTPTPQAEAGIPALGIAPKAVIVIDPGEGRSEGILPTQIRESDITLAVAQKLAAILKKSGNNEVILTRDSKSASLRSDQRTETANEKKAQIFISLQCGKLFSPTVSRAAVYFMNPALDSPSTPAAVSTAAGEAPRWDTAYLGQVPESLRLAREIHQRLDAFYKNANIIKMDSNPRPGRLAVLRGLTMPGVVIELGNLAHDLTAQYLARERVQTEIADELSMAITKFIYERAGMSAVPAVH